MLTVIRNTHRVFVNFPHYSEVASSLQLPTPFATRKFATYINFYMADFLFVYYHKYCAMNYKSYDKTENNGYVNR